MRERPKFFNFSGKNVICSSEIKYLLWESIVTPSKYTMWENAFPPPKLANQNGIYKAIFRQKKPFISQNIAYIEIFFSVLEI